MRLLSLLTITSALFIASPALADDFIGVGGTFTPQDSTTNEGEIFVKKTIFDFGDYQNTWFPGDGKEFSVNGNIGLNTGTELTGLVSLDLDIKQKLDTWVGLGFAYRLDSDASGLLTGDSDSVIPVAEIGVKYDFRPWVGLYSKFTTPFNYNDDKGYTASFGVGLNF